MKPPTNRAAVTMRRLRTRAALHIPAAIDIVEGHTIECRLYINTVWMVDGCRRSALDTLAFINALYKASEK